ARACAALRTWCERARAWAWASMGLPATRTRTSRSKFIRPCCWHARVRHLRRRSTRGAHGASLRRAARSAWDATTAARSRQASAPTSLASASTTSLTRARPTQWRPRNRLALVRAEPILVEELFAPQDVGVRKVDEPEVRVVPGRDLALAGKRESSRHVARGGSGQPPEIQRASEQKPARGLAA